MKYYFEFNQEKNLKLITERGISFEEIIVLIRTGNIISTIEHPNRDKYPNQWIFNVDVNGYCYMVPFVKVEKQIFLKTIIPSRKATKEYLKKYNNEESKNE